MKNNQDPMPDQVNSIRIKANPVQLLTIVLLITACKGDDRPLPFQEQHRPQYHFTPPAKWMNDPNGMVCYDGEYHLFYQYFPDSTVWGPMHWGHAVSKDLVHWEHLPIALYPDSLGYIFSGSAVIDWNNTSGLQQGGHPPMIAVFTQHDETRLRQGRTDYQNQCMAISHDKGRTFTKYTSNPVIVNPGEKDFRDPKVIWHGKSQKWVMVLAAGQKVMFYSSPDLLHWQYQSEFGTEAGAHGGVWECPDLFPLGREEQGKWILIVNINPGGPNGGSGTQYFTGDFNGTVFFNDNPDDTILWLDYGPDSYAGVTWSDLPAADGRRIFMGWMNNWDYAQAVPTLVWRGAMTLPRNLTLMKTGHGLRVCANPVNELEKIRKNDQVFELQAGAEKLLSGLNEIMIRVNLSGTSAEEFGIIFSNVLNEKLLVGYNVRTNRYFVNRTYSGKTEFSPRFTKEIFAPRIACDSILQMHLFLDRSSLELFTDGGLVTITTTFFPHRDFDRMSFFQKNGEVLDNGSVLYDLDQAWQSGQGITGTH